MGGRGSGARPNPRARTLTIIRTPGLTMKIDDLGAALEMNQTEIIQRAVNLLYVLEQEKARQNRVMIIDNKTGKQTEVILV